MDFEALEEFVRRGQAADRDATLVLYRSMPLRELRQLHAAFIADRQSARGRNDTSCIAFCDARLALIAIVLHERGDGA